MKRDTVRRRHKCVTGIACGLALCLLAGAANAGMSLISTDQLRRDTACGPRALLALVRITGFGRPECNLEHIYNLIGKPVYTTTTLKELRDAAQKLGFSAEGRKLTVKDLATLRGYAILPVGGAKGTQSDPLHFILVKRLLEDVVITVNTRSLRLLALSADDLRKNWNGYALVIPSTSDGHSLLKSDDSVDTVLDQTGEDAADQNLKWDEVKDFGPVESGSKLTHTFTIPDSRKKKVKIVQKSCACVEATIARDSKGYQQLTVVFHVDNPGWQNSSVVVLLEPGKIIKRYAVRAYGSDTFHVMPRVGYVHAPKGGRIDYPIRIDYFTGVDDDVRFERMDCDLPAIEIGPVKSTSNVHRKSAKVFTFEIPLIYDPGKSDEKVRMVRTRIEFVLNTTAGKRYIPFSITARTGADQFRLSPEQLFVMASKSGGKTTTKVKVEFLGETLPQRITVRPDDTLPLEIETAQASRHAYLISISTAMAKLQDVAQGVHKGEIAIISEGVTDHPAIRLPVVLFVRQ